MIFEDILPAFKKFQPIRKRSMALNDEFIFLGRMMALYNTETLKYIRNKSEPLLDKSEQYTAFIKKGKCVSMYQFTADDILSTEWEVVNEDEPSLEV